MTDALSPDAATTSAPMPAASVGSMRSRALTVAALVALAIFLAYSARRVWRAAEREGAHDWTIYYEAGLAFREGRDPYAIHLGGFLRFNYAPAVAAASAPLTFFPPGVARLIWFALDCACLALIFRLSKDLIMPAASTTARRIAAAVVFGLTLRYLMNQLYAGQTSSMFVLLTMLAVRWAGAQRAATAGWTAAAAVCLKLVPLAAVPWLAIRSASLRPAAWFAAASAALLIVPALAVGWDGNLTLLSRWADQLGRQMETPEQAWRIQNQSVQALLTRLLSPNDYGSNVADLSLSAAGFVGTGAACLAGAALYVHLLRRRTGGQGGLRDAEAVCLLLIYITIFNPLAWRYNFVAMIPPYFAAAEWVRRSPGRPWGRAALVAGAYALHSVPHGVHPALDWMLILGARTWGAVLLAVPVLWLGGQAEPTPAEAALKEQSGATANPPLPNPAP